MMLRILKPLMIACAVFNVGMIALSVRDGVRASAYTRRWMEGQP